MVSCFSYIVIEKNKELHPFNYCNVELALKNSEFFLFPLKIFCRVYKYIVNSAMRKKEKIKGMHNEIH